MRQEQLFLEIFKGRKDCVGHVIGGEVKSVQFTGNNEELLQKINKHLQGKQRLGFYNKLDDLTVQWAVVEFEDHGSGKVPDPWGYSLKLKQLLADFGIDIYIERSKNERGNSYHNWIFFEKPLGAGYVHDVLTALLKNIDPNVSPEVFPKSGDANLGNFVWLPLFGGRDAEGLGIQQRRTVFIDENGTPFADQWDLLGNIRRVPESGFNKIESQYGIVLPSDIDAEVSQRTDQPGLNRILENCQFIKYCTANAKTLGEPLWYAMISNLCRFKGGREKIHELSTPYPGYSKTETDRKIEHALAVFGPITYAKIKKDGWPGEVPEWPKSPAGWGFHLDLQGRIDHFNEIDDDIVRSRAVEKFLAETVSRQSPLRREAIIRAIGVGCDISIKALREALARVSAEFEVDYSQPLDQILYEIDSSVEKGHIAFEWFTENGGKFYKDREHNCFLYHRDQIFQIDSNRPFKSLMFKVADISESTPGGKIIFDAMANLAFEKGHRMDSCSWQFTDLIDNRIYINLNNEKNELIRISPGGIEILKNGNNDGSIFLQGSNKIQPIVYTELNDSERREGFTKIKELVFDNLACAPEDRYLYLSWALVFPLIGYLRTIPHMRLEGISGSGKSRGMELISYLIYGESALKCATVASNYTDGALNPLILLDNIESRNLSQALEDFIITAVTGIKKEKRKLGTDKENIGESVKTLINSSGIESLNKNELINRTLIIDFDRSLYGNSKYSELVYGEIIRHRNIMLSAFFQMIGEIYTRIINGELEKVKADISTKYPNHSKDRADNYLAIMRMIAGELIGYFGDLITLDDLFERWIIGQDSHAQTTSADTNPILQYLSSLMVEFKRGHDFKEDYEIKGTTGVMGKTCQLTGTAGNFFATFTKLAKKKGLPMDYKSAGVLAKRFKDSQKILNEAGWLFEESQLRSRVVEYTFKYSPEKSGEDGEAENAPSPPASPEVITTVVGS